MALYITEGEVAAILFVRAVRKNAPAPVQTTMDGYIACGDWRAMHQWAAPLAAQLKLPAFTAAELGEVAPLSQARQDVYLFLRDLQGPGAEALKERVDVLREWGGWDSIAKIVSDNPRIPFQFTGEDVRAVADPARRIPALTLGQIQAKTFLNTVAMEPALAPLKERIDKMREWGGWDSIAKIVVDNPKIPFQFTGADVKAVLAPGSALHRSTEETGRLLNIWTFYSGLQTASADNADVAKFFGDITARVRHGCWTSIADLVNGNEKIPFKGFTVVDLKVVLDPQGQYGDDPVCSALAPPAPPAWTVPIVWTMQAGKDVADWTVNASDDVTNWTVGAADDVEDWTVGATNSVADWTTDAGGSVADWTTGAGDSVADWTKGAATDTKNWVSDSSNTVANVFKKLKW